MTCFSYTNGKFIPSYKAKISINDRSVHFSDAVYEVVTVYNHRILYKTKVCYNIPSNLKSRFILDYTYYD